MVLMDVVTKLLRAARDPSGQCFDPPCTVAKRVDARAEPIEQRHVEVGERRPLSVTDVAAAPDPRRLLQLGALEAVLLQGNAITLLKPVDGPSWDTVLSPAREAIEAHFADLDARQSTDRPEMSAGDKQLALDVQQLLNTEINPMVATHGGFIEVLAVQAETVYVHMGGGCQGCGMATATLKQGVETVVFQAFPKITSVLDTTDHAAGTNPYYAPQ